MNQDLFDWILLLVRWLHITTAVTWIGTSIFFMWLDRSFEKMSTNQNPAHLGEVWMVHGGGFYRVEKLEMGPTPVPPKLHWFKWESYWTWMSGFALLSLIFFTGSGTFLLDSSVAPTSFARGILIALFAIFGSWFFYDALWERDSVRDDPLWGHLFTLAWFVGMTYFLCHTLAGRAAYLIVGAMLGTWMTANVFMRIIPRQLKMVERSKRGESLNPDWAKNAKNRSTHNTYFTLPVIFIMLSNHFPSTYGHDLNWLILIAVTAAGAMIREFFVRRLSRPRRAWGFLAGGLALLTAVIHFSGLPTTRGAAESVAPSETIKSLGTASPKLTPEGAASLRTWHVRGRVTLAGEVPEMKILSLPQACAKQHPGPVRSNEVLVHNGGLQNVLVRITRGAEGLPAAPVPTSALEIDQRGCLYRPRVAVAFKGQEVVFINSDPVFHNVKSLSRENPSFNLAMPQQHQRESRRFEKTEIFQTRCSVHPWMEALVAVVDNLYFSLTDAEGKFDIAALPPGTYTLEFWHEVFGRKSRDITVSDSDALEINEVFRKDEIHD